MRLDKYLKVSRIIKRRTVACEACEQGKVTVNGKAAKPSANVKEGDILEVTFGERVLKAEIVSIQEHVLKGDASAMYRVTGDIRTTP